jgi:hypothetical protein
MELTLSKNLTILVPRVTVKSLAKWPLSIGTCVASLFHAAEGVCMRSKEKFSRRSPLHWCFSFVCVAVWLGALCSDARASAIFEWVCDDPNCSGDPDFTAFLELSDAAVAAGDFTGVTGNILSAGITSRVGDGFSLKLNDLRQGSLGSPTDDFHNIRIVLNPARTEINEIFDVTIGPNITFFGPNVGLVDFWETTGDPYFVAFVQDLHPSPASLSNIPGRFVLQVPEPGSFGLLALSALGVCSYQHRRRRSEASSRA